MQNVCWDAKNFFGDTKNFLGDTKFFLGIRKLFSGCKVLFFSGNKSFWLTEIPEHHTNHKPKMTKINQKKEEEKTKDLFDFFLFNFFLCADFPDVRDFCCFWCTVCLCCCILLFLLMLLLLFCCFCGCFLGRPPRPCHFRPSKMSRTIFCILKKHFVSPKRLFYPKKKDFCTPKKRIPMGRPGGVRQGVSVQNRGRDLLRPISFSDQSHFCQSLGQSHSGQAD